MPVDFPAIPACGWPAAFVPSRPNASVFSTALSTRNSNAGIACAKGTPECPERMAIAVKKNSRLRLMSNFHLHRRGHWIAFTESEAKVIWTHSNLADEMGWLHTATGTTCTAGRTGAVKGPHRQNETEVPHR